jgi:hypothetical protein
MAKPRRILVSLSAGGSAACVSGRGPGALAVEIAPTVRWSRAGRRLPCR